LRCCKSACSSKDGTDGSSTTKAAAAEAAAARAAAASRSKAIDMQLRRERRERRSEVRLLLLGAGESGKSTFVKQMRIINGVPFTQQELDEYRSLIQVSIIRGLQILLKAKKKMGVTFANAQLEPQADMALAFTSYHSINSSNMANLAVLCQLLWNDPALKEVYKRRAEFQVMDSIGYFLDNLERIAHRDWVPSNQDILYARRTTREISEFKIRMQEVDFVFLDVGGQRTQREKWFDLFSQEITATLFMASASEFDQTLREDARENRLKESIIIFRTLVNNSGFRETPFILFLNKMDLLEEKVRRLAAALIDAKNSVKSSSNSDAQSGGNNFSVKSSTNCDTNGGSSNSGSDVKLSSANSDANGGINESGNSVKESNSGVMVSGSNDDDAEDQSKGSKGDASAIGDYFDEFNEDEAGMIAKFSQGRKFGRDPGNLEDVKTFILSMFLRNVNQLHKPLPPTKAATAKGSRREKGTSSSSSGTFRKSVYHHFTIATNTDNIRLVFQSVRDSILRKNLDALMLE